MSDIDPEKLERAISEAHKEIFGGDRPPGQAARMNAFDLEILMEAATVTLATLPRFKEVKRECWEVVSDDGICRGFFPTENAALGIARLAPDRHVVRLTGTAKVKVNP